MQLWGTLPSPPISLLVSTTTTRRPNLSASEPVTSRSSVVLPEKHDLRIAAFRTDGKHVSASDGSA